jgi:hypothetical protein
VKFQRENKDLQRNSQANKLSRTESRDINKMRPSAGLVDKRQLVEILSTGLIQAGVDWMQQIGCRFGAHLGGRPD